jgi:hypothetical protein
LRLFRSRLSTAAILAALVALALPPGAARAAGDPERSRQWGLTTIGVPAAWSSSTGAGVRIGIVDSGVDLAHEDLASKVVANAGCIGTTGDPARCTAGGGQDDFGHGTHVSGIAAAATGNGIGIAGVAPDAQLVVAKVLTDQGSGDINDVNAGIKWVVDHGAKVVNLSLGQDSVLTGLLGSSLDVGVEYAWSHGAIPVLAAGNSNLFGLGSADYGEMNAVVVGATGRNDTMAGYSSPVGNAKWALVAPGGDGISSKPENDIYSTWWESGKRDQYKAEAGTSMATPHVSGTLALLLARGLTPQAAVDTLLATADRRVQCGSNCRGRLDAAAALGSLPATTTTTTTSSTTTSSTTTSSMTTTTTSGPKTTSPTRTTTPNPTAGSASSPGDFRPGYVMADERGRVRAFGDEVFSGELATAPNRPIVGLDTVPGPAPGYWLVASDGGIFSFGDARFLGSTGAMRLNQPIVGMAATPTGEGYWLVASDGGIFSFGDARFFGSTGAMRLNQPIVVMVSTPTGTGYSLVASDGGIFSFGDAGFFGSTGGMRLNQPIAGMAPAPGGRGYWLAAADGGLFAFGAAPYAGSAAGAGLDHVVGIAAG